MIEESRKKQLNGDTRLPRPAHKSSECPRCHGKRWITHPNAVLSRIPRYDMACMCPCHSYSWEEKHGY